MINSLFANTLFSPSATAISAIGGVVLWKTLNWAWANFRPLKTPTEFAKKWAYKKGLAFGIFYDRRIMNPELRKSIKNDISNSSNEIQEAFVRGLLANEK